MDNVNDSIKERIAVEVGKQVGANLIPAWRNSKLALGEAREVFSSILELTSNRPAQAVFTVVSQEDYRPLGFVFTKLNFRDPEFRVCSIVQTDIASKFERVSGHDPLVVLLVVPEVFIHAAVSNSIVTVLDCSYMPELEGQTFSVIDFESVVEKCREIVRPILVD